MKKRIELDDKYAISDAMRDLKVYLTMMYLPIEESFFSDDVDIILSEYFRSKNSVVKSEYEQIFVQAIARLCFEDSDIPKEKAVNVARRMSSEFIECSRLADLTYQYLCSEGPFEGLVPGSKVALKVLKQEQEANTFLRKVGMRMKMKKVAKRLVGFSAKKKAIFISSMKITGGNITLSEILSISIALANRILPKTVREKINAEAKKVRECARAATKKIGELTMEKLNKTLLGQTILEAIETVGSVVKEVGQSIKEVVKDLSQEGKNLYQIVTNKVKKSRKWIKVRMA